MDSLSGSHDSFESLERAMSPRVSQSESQALRDTIKEMQSLIEAKQEQIYQLEKRELQYSVSRVEEEMLYSLQKELEQAHRRIQELEEDKYEPETHIVKVEDFVALKEENKRLQNRISHIIADSNADRGNELRIQELEDQLLALKLSKNPNSLAKTNSELTIRVKELEAELEKASNQYIQKLSKVNHPPDVSLLKNQLLHKDRLIQRLESRAKQAEASIFKYISGSNSNTWASIYRHVLAAKDITYKMNSDDLIAKLAVLKDELQDFSEELLNMAANASAVTKRSENWVEIEKIVSNMQEFTEKEILKLSHVSSQTLPLGSEQDYWSDFSDEDCEVELMEDEVSFQTLQSIRKNSEVLSKAATGLVPLHVLCQIFQVDIPTLSALQVHSFIRRVPSKNGNVDFDLFLDNLLKKSNDWWRTTLSDVSFENRNRISKKGNYESLLTGPVLSCMTDLIKEKIEDFIAQQGKEPELFIDVIFQGRSKIPKREFRRQILAKKVPISREDTHILTQKFDHEGFVLAESMKLWLLERPEPSVPVKTEDFTEEYKQLSERDAQFLLLQANKRIKELESQNHNVTFTTDYTLNLKVKTIQEENLRLQNRIQGLANEIHSLEHEKKQLQSSFQSFTETDELRARIKQLESTNELAEQDFRNRLQAVNLSAERQMEDLQRKFESEKQGLYRIITLKNRQIDELNSQNIL